MPENECYKALIDSGLAISLIRHSTYQLIDDSFKMSIQPTTTKLNTADRSPMMALGMTALHLRITNFKFGTDVQKQFSLSYAWDKEKNCYIQRDGRFLTYTRSCEQKVTIGTVKSMLKIPSRHNGIVHIKIKDHSITGHTTYFISNQD